jgi:hypothetical protein
MASKYRDRYGISGLEVENLIRRFYRRLYDSEWERADDFVKWCSENGYESGLRLCRKDTSKPHGPENSYFKKPEKTVRVIAKDKRRRKEERKSLVSPFCEGCTEACRKGVGCERWQQYYVTNWDKNIRVAKPVEVKPEPEGPMVFRYEHPDLVREGIVFDPSR